MLDGIKFSRFIVCPYQHWLLFVNLFLFSLLDSKFQLLYWFNFFSVPTGKSLLEVRLSFLLQTTSILFPVIIHPPNYNLLAFWLLLWSLLHCNGCCKLSLCLWWAVGVQFLTHGNGCSCPWVNLTIEHNTGQRVHTQRQLITCLRHHTDPHKPRFQQNRAKLTLPLLTLSASMNLLMVLMTFLHTANLTYLLMISTTNLWYKPN